MAATDTPAALEISPDKVCFIIARARAFDAKDVLTDIDSGSNAADDGMREVLEDSPNDPAVVELMSAIAALNEDEQIDLVALAWLGRGDDDVGNWPALRSQAEERRNRRTVRYLAGMPLLGDFLEEGLSLMGHSCDGLEAVRS